MMMTIPFSFFFWSLGLVPDICVNKRSLWAHLAENKDANESLFFFFHLCASQCSFYNYERNSYHKNEEKLPLALTVYIISWLMDMLLLEFDSMNTQVSFMYSEWF